MTALDGTIEESKARRQWSQAVPYANVEETWQFFGAVTKGSIGRWLRALHSKCRVIPRLARRRVPAYTIAALDALQRSSRCTSGTPVYSQTYQGATRCSRYRLGATTTSDLRRAALQPAAPILS